VKEMLSWKTSREEIIWET